MNPAMERASMAHDTNEIAVLLILICGCLAIYAIGAWATERWPGLFDRIARRLSR
jgi:hypothetical protein